VVAAFERAVEPLVELTLEQPWPLLLLVPAAGLGVVSLLAARWGDGDTTTTDAYVRAYHQRGGGLGVRAGLRKLTLSAISLGSGSAMGFEGPSLLAGATVGSAVERRFLGR